MSLPRAAVRLRDEVQHRILSELSVRSDTPQSIVFRGGTMLRSYVYEPFRYSEDLDFYVTDGDQDKLRETTESIVEQLKNQLALLEMSYTRNPHGADFILLGKTESEGWINVDVFPEKRELEIAKDARAIKPRYSGLNTVAEMPCMSLLDVIATKYNCLANRPEPRDLYDFWMLSQHTGLAEEGWRKYCDTWEAYMHPVAPEEIFPAFKGWKNTVEKYWPRESSYLSFPPNPGFDTLYTAVTNIFVNL